MFAFITCSRNLLVYERRSSDNLIYFSGTTCCRPQWERCQLQQWSLQWQVHAPLLFHGSGTFGPLWISSSGLQGRPQQRGLESQNIFKILKKHISECTSNRLGEIFYLKISFEIDLKDQNWTLFTKYHSIYQGMTKS